MDVIFETCDGRRFEEEIWFFSPVLEIKEKLHKHHGFPISHQTLFFNGKMMEDERDIEYYNVLQGSRILLLLEPKPNSKPNPNPEPEPEPESQPDPPRPTNCGGRKVKVTVLLPRVGMGMRRVQLEVNLADKVSELRKELLRMRERNQSLYLPVEGFFFICNQSVMEEERTFRWHKVRSEDVIEIFNGSVTGGS